MAQLSAPQITSVATDTSFFLLQGTATPNTIVTITGANGVGSTSGYVDQYGTIHATIQLPDPGTYNFSAVDSAAGQVTSAAVAFTALVLAPTTGVHSFNNFTTVDLAAAFPNGFRFEVASAGQVDLADAVISVGPMTQQAQIQRLYVGLLGRDADLAGLTSAEKALQSGASYADIATGIITSTEYATDHGTPPLAQFINYLYQGFLGRDVDGVGITTLTFQSEFGLTRGQAAVEVANSTEAQTHLAAATNEIVAPVTTAFYAEINASYRTALGRNVDTPAKLSDTAALNAGTPLLSIIQGIVASPEYAADHLGQSNTALVASFYQNALGRAPDVAGGAADVAMLNAGASPTQVLMGIGQSPEASAYLTRPLPA